MLSVSSSERVCDRTDLADGVRPHEPAEHLHFLFWIEIADGDPHQETVELCLRERECAFELDRILRGENHEWLG